MPVNCAIILGADSTQRLKDTKAQRVRISLRLGVFESLC